jgi:hypothetical protein
MMSLAIDKQVFIIIGRFDCYMCAINGPDDIRKVRQLVKFSRNVCKVLPEEMYDN